MLEQIKEILKNNLDEIGLFISSINYEKVGNDNYLKIELDSDNIIDVLIITKASTIINEILDTNDIIKDSYILDIFSKEKGVENE
ncbi:MAG: hypothetical protein RR359_02400 [Bacilli bacterium]